MASRIGREVPGKGIALFGCNRYGSVTYVCVAVTRSTRETVAACVGHSLTLQNDRCTTRVPFTSILPLRGHGRDVRCTPSTRPAHVPHRTCMPKAERSTHDHNLRPLAASSARSRAAFSCGVSRRTSPAGCSVAGSLAAATPASRRASAASAARRQSMSPLPASRLSVMAWSAVSCRLIRLQACSAA